ncbi:uncharacterized protein LOC126832928 [Adelges cooleyi]|uniref:uncharacterized protein LOC126832928 n=1 Tax=Adelges cooleyi TaxID=133065 RepID=UPI00217FBFDC|nr:uncharacterized protein LOC126832928 [Adelges cooleyi]
MDYQLNTAITNAYVHQAFEKKIVGPDFAESGLEQVIKNIIGDDITYGLGAILNMIAIPDTPYKEDFEESARNQTALREKIQSELDIQLPPVPSGLTPLPLKELGIRRRKYTIQALRNIFSQVVEAQLSPLWLCRLTALFVSTKFPMAYIRDIQTGPNVCFTYDGVAADAYRKIGGEWRHFVGDINLSSIKDVFV